MLDATRFAKTEKGLEEISARRNNLRGKLRTMLILTDASKSAAELRVQAAQIGVPEDFLESLLDAGYIAPAGFNGPSAAGVPANGSSGAEPVTITRDELARFRDAKSFMNETVVSALGIRAFMFTLRLERCTSRAELAELLPDYERALRKASTEPEARVMGERMKELLAA